MKAKYDQIGINYNLTRKADEYLIDQLLTHLNPNKNGLYLDIGCGTGNYTSELQKKGFQFIGIDPSKEMLEKAQLKNKNIQWRSGKAENTGLSAESVDGIIGTLTIHHWNDLKKAFSEDFRILKNGGRIVLFTSTPEQMDGYWLNHYFPQMLKDSKRQMPSFENVKSAMENSGIEFVKSEPYFIKPDLKDQFLYCGKENPELYFNDDIRNGISSFSALSNQEEVEQGLTELRRDIDSGEINNIIKSYENNLGDYLYIVGQKPAGNIG